MVRFTLLLMLSILTLVSCGDDDDNMSNSDIEGTWALESSTTGSELVASGILSRSVTIFQSGDVEIEFKGDGTFEQSGMGKYLLSNTFDGDTTIPAQIIELNLTGSGTYVAVNGRLEGFNDANSSNPAITNDNTVTNFSINGGILTLDVSGTFDQDVGGGAVVEVEPFGTVVYRRL